MKSLHECVMELIENIDSAFNGLFYNNILTKEIKDSVAHALSMANEYAGDAAHFYFMKNSANSILNIHAAYKFLDLAVKRFNEGMKNG